jgi:CDP-glycerol glycerophosphotransferase (TagB/SpsB family)
MPTFRDGFARNDFDFGNLDRAATTAGVVVYVKLHFVDAERGIDDHGGWAQWPSLRLIDPTIDPIILYPEVDGLITDFSSAAFDFMLLRKPIIYFVPDYDRFLSLRSLYYPFDDVTPGPKCRTFEELAAAMATTTRVGIGSHETHYQCLLDRFYTHRDGKSSERAYSAIRERLVCG